MIFMPCSLDFAGVVMRWELCGSQLVAGQSEDLHRVCHGKMPVTFLPNQGKDDSYGEMPMTGYSRRAGGFSPGLAARGVLD
jgi:hypothetical protein